MTFDDSIGPTVRVFEPKARVYFDTGWEAPDKLDLFHDGVVSAEHQRAGTILGSPLAGGHRPP